MKIARRSNYNIDLRKKGKFKNCKTDAVIIRILTDVSAMLPSSGYTRINNVRSSLNLAHAIDGIIARVPNEIARYGARVTKRKKKGGVIHVKLKSWLRPLGPAVPYLNINLISCFLRYSWLARPAFNTATFMSSSV